MVSSSVNNKIIIDTDIRVIGTVTLYREAEIKGFDASLFKTEQVFYESKDKTKVPMFIVSKKVWLGFKS